MNYYLTLFSTTWRATFTKRATFFAEMLSMMINNLLFFALWWVFFRAFPKVGSWGLQDMCALYAIMSIASGASGFFFGGARLISSYIISSEIDRFLLRPKNTLFSILLSKSYPRSIGDMISVFFYLYVGSLYSAQAIATIFSIAILVALIIASLRTLVASFTFWIRNINEVGEKYFDCVMIFSLYPTNVYPYYFRFILFTLFPAGLIGFLPTEIVRDFSWEKCGLLLGLSVCFVLFSLYTFYRGLKRYESGFSF